MKTIILSILAIVFTINVNAVTAGGKKEKVTIKTSAQCDMCVERITKALYKLDGVKVVVFDGAQDVNVTFDSEKTNVEALRDAITADGYDADDKLAVAAAYDKLPDCCQKPAIKTD